MKIDYHIHTPLCNHAVGAMTAYVRRAHQIGMQEICFLDHLTLRAADPGLSMTPEEVPIYFLTAQRLKYRYRQTIRVKVGLEVDFDLSQADRIEKIIRGFPFDVIGCSVHYLDGFDVVTSGSAWANGGGDTEDIHRRYLRQLEKVLDYPFFDMICHLDLLKKFNRRPTRAFEDDVDSVLIKIKARDLALELNTSGFEHPVQEAYPSPGILKKCRQMDIPVTLGSDSHAPKHIGRHFDRAKTLLREAGYSTLATFTHRVRGSVPID